VTRIVSFYDQARDGDAGDGDTPFTKGVSIQWHDDAYGFIMGSWSPVALSNFESPLCAANATNSRRFFRGWVLAPRILPPPRQPGWGVFPAANRASKAGVPMGGCAAHYRRALTLWIVDDVAFRAARLRAVVSHHYASVDREGIAPGPAEQVERTYWTKEFGLTRWEKWSREDWRHPHSQRSAGELGAALFERDRCGRPYSLPAAINAGTAMEPVRDDGAYSQVAIDPRTGERHRWFVTLCEDYTNLAPSPPASFRGAANAKIEPAFWLE
jgi:hypothetical protein